MKNFTLLVLLFIGFLTTTVTAQETIWLDANWQKTTKDKATFYRPAPQPKDNGFWIVDYYKDGTKQMEGFSTTNSYDNEQFEGLVQYYFSSGKLSHALNFSKGKLEGNRKEYYESGELKELAKYKEGKRNGIFKSYYKNGKIESKGKYSNGEKVGVWKTFYKNDY